MKHLKTYNNLFESLGGGLRKASPELRKEIEDRAKSLGIEVDVVWEDGSVDVDGWLEFFNKPLRDYRLPIKFRNVTGSFIIMKTAITTLEGCPEIVGEGPDIEGVCFQLNELPYLTSLEGGPHTVYGDYIITHCEMKDLKGAAQLVSGSLALWHSDFTSLEGLPKNIYGILTIQDCRKLWDPTGLQDVNIEDGLYINGSTPLSGIAQPFGVETSRIASGSTEYIKNFIRSLDYNYLVKEGDKWKVIKWKYKEALDELGLRMPYKLDHYDWKE